MSVKTNPRRKARETARRTERAIPADYLVYAMGDALQFPAPAIRGHR